MHKYHSLTPLFVLLFCFSRADVTISSTRVCIGTSTSFTNTSNIPATKFVDWDLNNDGFFDDATGNNVSYLYTKADSFEVRLRITDSLGVEYFSNPHLVIVDPVPVALFQINGVCLGAPTLFQTQSSISDGTPLTYAWDFTNDGAIDNSSPAGSYQYPTTGIFTVKHTVTSNQGCAVSLSKTVKIVQPPAADFSATAACANSPALFTNLSDYNTSKLKLAVWNFGDETYSFNGDSVFHTYSGAGTYTIKLIVTDTSGCVDSVTKTITIQTTVVNSYTLSNGNEIFENGSTTATVTGDFVSIMWNDSTTQPVKTITQPGYYSYTVTNGINCTAQNGFSVSTKPLPSELQHANDFLTPNGDGKNDVLFFLNKHLFGKCSIRIYDYRGLHIYSEDDYQNNWDGGNYPSGTYYYFIKCENAPELKGTTNIIR